MCFCFFKQKTAYEMRISDWSSDVCSSDVGAEYIEERPLGAPAEEQRLVQANAPFAQGADHAFVRRRRARGDQRGAELRLLPRRIRRLQEAKRAAEPAERPARESVRGGKSGDGTLVVGGRQRLKKK